MSIATVEQAPRRRRYQRQLKPHRPHLEITERDLDILALAHEHRFLRTPHILGVFATTDGARRSVRRRVRYLFDHGFLDQVRGPVDPYERGSKPNIYALGDNGADELFRRRGIPRARSSQRDKNREVGHVHLDHTLLVTDLMAAFESHARHRGEVRVIYGDEIAAQAPETDRDERRRFEWKVEAPVELTKGMGKSTVPVKPDKTFGLEYAGYPEGKNRSWFFVEADRGTESQIPSRNILNPKKTTIFHKYLGLFETGQQHLHTELFGFKGFRVLTVATGTTRMANMMGMAMKAMAATGRNPLPKQFLFTDSATLTAHASDILKLEWLTADGQRTTL